MLKDVRLTSLFFLGGGFEKMFTVRLKLHDAKIDTL